MASLATRLSDLITAVGTDIKQLRTWITGSSSGDLTGLTTTDKSNIVAAVNEVKAGSTGSPPSASTTVQGVIEIATLTEVDTGTDTVRAVTPQGVRQERDAVKTEILGAGVPAALDTLDELAAALGDDANFAATVTTALGNKQPLDSDLTAIAALTSAANKLPYATGAGAWALTDLSAFIRTLLDDADAATALSTLGAQPLDSDLTAIAALASAANKLPYATGAGAWALADLSAFARTLLDDADASAALTTLGAQPLDSDLTAIAALTSAADKVAYATGAGTWALTTQTAFARTLLDDVDAATALGTLGAQPADSDLTAIAALTSAADKLAYATGAGTWALTAFTAAGRALVDDADAAAQRTTLSVYSQAEIGNPDTDLVALYTTAKA
jgi:hypothetical protein